MDEENTNFSDRQVNLIIKKALEIQQKEMPSGEKGLSIKDVEQLGTEIGISSDVIKRAAAEIMQKKHRNSLIFGKTGSVIAPSIEFDRLLSGEQLAELNAAIPSIIRSPGIGQPRKNGLYWSSLNTMQTGLCTEVIASKTRDNKTALTVRERLGVVAGALYGGITGGLGLGLGIGLPVPLAATGLISPILSVLGLLLCLGGSFFLSRWIFTWFAKRRKKRLEKILSELKNSVQDLQQ